MKYPVDPWMVSVTVTLSFQFDDIDRTWMNNMTDFPQRQLQQNDETGNLDTAAGGAAAGTQHGQYHQNGLGQFRPFFIVCRNKACGTGDGRYLEHRMTESAFPAWDTNERYWQ